MSEKICLKTLLTNKNFINFSNSSPLVGFHKEVYRIKPLIRACKAKQSVDSK